MFEITKREKQEKVSRQNLKMFLHLLSEQEEQTNYWDRMLQKTEPKIGCNLLVNQLFDPNHHLDKQCRDLLSQKIINQEENEPNKITQSAARKKYVKHQLKQTAKSISELQIGIIGGGVMGRLILNSLLVFTKDGLNPKNIWLSTRQFEDMKMYEKDFRVKLTFDNQLVAKTCDIVIICVPGTLDNWIINDLKDILQDRINQSHRTNPLVYVTTSDMHEDKLKKLFDFPILTPTIRGSDQQILTELTTAKSCQQIEKKLVNFLFSEANVEKFKEALQFIYYKLYNPAKNISFTSSSYQYQTSKTVSVHASLPHSGLNSLKQSKGQSINDDDKEETLGLKQTISQVLYWQNSSISETFLLRSRKWRIAYHNYIA